MQRAIAILLALAASPSFALASTTQDGLPLAQAPDGERGFGAGHQPRALRRSLRKPVPEDAVFLSGLWDLARDVEILGAIAAARYDQLGYFELVNDPAAGARRDLEALHRGFREYERRGLRIALGDQRGLALARAMADPWFLARMKVLVDVGYDLRQLRGALALLLVHTHGRAEYRAGAELDELTRRADLAASRLRAARADLEHLYQPATPKSGGDTAQVLRLARAFSRGGGDGAREALKVVKTAARGEERALSEGVLAAFDREHQELLKQRAEGSRKCTRNYSEMLTILPLTPEGRLPDGLEGKNSERYHQAADTGLEAARLDPLDADVQLMLGIAYDFFAGRELSMPRLDRYLALRGIRHWDHRTFQGRVLTVQEVWALFVVAGWTPPKNG